MNVHTGKALGELDHIKQSITDILATPLGSRVMRREYGSALADLIDQPLNDTTLLQCYAATAMAIAQWEPRVKLEKVRREISGDLPGIAALELEVTRLDTGTPNTATLNLQIPTGLN